MINRKIMEAGFRSKFNVNVLGIRRKNDYLLQDLGDRGLDHRLIRLEIPAHRAQDPEQKDRRRKDSQDGNRIVFYQDSRSEVQEQAPHRSYDQRVYKRAVKSALRIPVLSDRQSLGHDL